MPVIYPLLLFVWPFVCGIPMMLYYTKIQKFGMLTITGVIYGLFFFLIGYTWIGGVDIGRTPCRYCVKGRPV